MFCTHPHLVDCGIAEDPALSSTKYQRLLEILEEIRSRGEKALIFTSFTGMIDILLRDLPVRMGIRCDWIDGRVKVEERQLKIDQLAAQKGSAVLVLNPRAAGIGLNIQAANHVIHYNLEWNPAVEDQATARAFRTGQKQPVTVHRLYYANTLEEIIDERIRRKRRMAEEAVVGTDGEEQDYQDIMRALKISPVLGETGD